MIHNTVGIVIKKNDFRDYDRVLTLYTSDFGKIKVVAKSVRKSKAKLTSLTELFVVCEFRVFLRETADFGKIVGGVIVDSNSLIRYNIKKFYEASYICEVMDALTPARQPNTEKFLLLKESLSIISKSAFNNKDTSNKKDDFVEKLLHLTGFGIKEDVPLENILQEHLAYPLKTAR
ncbi:MAG: DNA repair protein RecO [Elusimicrobia bacterium]|nr:DNA repair protein RecO [Elusimicrobiota bacterium]